MLCRDRLLRLFLRDLVRLRGYERDELDRTVDQQVAGVFAEGEAGFVAEDLGDDLLDGCCSGALDIKGCPFVGQKSRAFG